MVYDYAIIGGGVVGSAIFNKFTRLGKKCILIEKENDVGFGASKANTALVHSGVDCKPKTLKAKLNVRGAELFPSICSRLGVKYVNNGHIIVGNDLQKLEELKERGKANKVKGLKIIDATRLQKLEPNISKEILFGLYVPTGGIVSSYELAVAFCEEAIVNGGAVVRAYDIKKIKKQEDYFSLSNLESEFFAKNIINASGSGYNNIAKLIGSEQYDIVHRRGEYYLLDNSVSDFVTRTIFPLPTKESKGIIVSPTTYGNILLGPTSEVSDDDRPITTSEGLQKVKEGVSKNFNNIPFNKNIRVFSGVRSVVGDDFIIEKSKVVSGVINLAGICSPGLSASPAIAEYVAELENINGEEVKTKQRAIYPKLSDLTIEEQDKLISENPDYGKVICKCESISLGEIKNCLYSPLPPLTVDGVKRRTRAGMGRCQGGFCIFAVMEELSKRFKVDFKTIEKDAVNSKIIISDIKNGRK